MVPLGTMACIPGRSDIGFSVAMIGPDVPPRRLRQPTAEAARTHEEAPVGPKRWALCRMRGEPRRLTIAVTTGNLDGRNAAHGGAFSVVGLGVGARSAIRPLGGGTAQYDNGGSVDEDTKDEA